MSAVYQCTKRDDGIYEVRAARGGNMYRAGMILGCTGKWTAERSDGRHIGVFKTRDPAVRALLLT